MEETKEATNSERFVLAAKNAGVPREQLENFIRGQYIPLPWQLKFHAIARQCDEPNGAVDIGGGGARGGGKSHMIFAQVMLDDCQRVKGLKALFLRQTGKSASESFDDLILQVLRGKIRYIYNPSNNILYFPNGSRVLLGGFETDKDIDKYVGIAYDLIAIEERNQITSEKVLKLRGSLRTSKENWRPRVYSSFNPGGISHQDLKTEFVEPYRNQTETTTRFIPAIYRDNPYLKKEYVDYLESLQGDLGRMWRDGDWDIFAGMFFECWRREKHIIEPFTIPNSWKRLRSIDVSGRNGWTACHWYAVDYDGGVICYKEHYKTGMDADEHAREITRLSEGETYSYTVVDNSAFSKVGLPETIAEVYIRNGVQGLVPSSKNRVAGWDFMNQYLRWEEKIDPSGNKIQIGPKLRFFSNCVNAIRTIPTLIRDERNPEDLDDRGECHLADADRYLLQTLREQKSPRPMSYVEQRLKILQEAEESLNRNY